MNQAWRSQIGDRLCWRVVLAVLVATILAACSDDEPLVIPPGDSYTGVWVGTVDGVELRFEIRESPDGVITGRVILGGPESADTLTITDGRRPEPDSLYLDVSGPIGPPLGCVEWFSGRRDDPNRLVGGHYYRCGHDPAVTVTAWSASRQRY